MSPKTLRLKSYSDPGHGWLAVPYKTFLLIQSVVTPWSYISATGKTVYLEEDCDTSAFVKKAKELGYEIKITTKWTNRQSKIRNLKRFSFNYVEGQR